MASIAMMAFGAVVNVASFIGGNYLARYLSGDSGKALCTFVYQAAYAKYQKDRTKLLEWIATNDRMKHQASQNFRTTDIALARYNQMHQSYEQIKDYKEPQFSDFYKPSPQQQTGELVFIGGSLLAVGYLAFRFL